MGDNQQFLGLLTWPKYPVVGPPQASPERSRSCSLVISCQSHGISFQEGRCAHLDRPMGDFSPHIRG